MRRELCVRARACVRERARRARVLINRSRWWFWRAFSSGIWPRQHVKMYRHFEGTYYLRLQGWNVSVLAAYLLGLNFDTEDGGNKFLFFSKICHSTWRHISGRCILQFTFCLLLLPYFLFLSFHLELHNYIPGIIKSILHLESVIICSRPFSLVLSHTVLYKTTISPAVLGQY
jgi:hypothetical protein